MYAIYNSCYTYMFINREQELRKLKEIERYAKKASQMTFIVGRRRVGKTYLINHFLKQKKSSLYFYVSRKKSTLLLSEFNEILKRKFPLIGKLATWDEFLETLIEINKKRQIIIIFDEFQNFLNIEPAVYSLFQKFWDTHHPKDRLNWIFVGSIQSLMNKIFTSQKEPLFKRANNRMVVLPFSPFAVKKTLSAFKRKVDITGLLEFYSVFGGIPWYYQLIKSANLMKANFWEIVKKLFLEKDAILKNEAKEILIEEFGSQHLTFFAILEAIAGGATRLNQIAARLNMPSTAIPQFLTELENKYGIIAKKQPLFGKQKLNSTYFVADQMTAFWFKFIYTNLSFIESGQKEYVSRQIKKEFDRFKGFVFEGIVASYLQESGRYLEIGSYWQRGGNEIDILAFNRETDSVLFGECKTNKNKINLETAKMFLEKTKNAPKNQAKNKKLLFFTVGEVGQKIRREILTQTGIEIINLDNV